jgi:hypothetical protein
LILHELTCLRVDAHEPQVFTAGLCAGDRYKQDTGGKSPMGKVRI